MKIGDLPDQPLAGRAARGGLLHALRDLPPYGLTLTLAVALLAVWEFVLPVTLGAFFTSTPSAIWRSVLALFSSRDMLYHFRFTLEAAALGFLIGTAAGTLVGVTLGRVPYLNRALTPFVIVFYTLPKLALAPLFIVWFGIGLPMKVALAATVVYFPVFLTAQAGAQNVTEELVDIVRIMGGSRFYVLSRIVLPSVLTWLFVGLKQSIPYALLGAVVGELIVSDRGAGHLLSRAAGQFDTAGVFAVLFVLVVLGYGSYEVVRLIEERAFPWKRSPSGSEPMES